MTCHACGTPLAASARFCHQCGAHVRTAQAAGWRMALPWGVAGLALGALIAVLAIRLSGGTGGSADAGGVQAPFAGSPEPGRASPPDISRMSPAERATRLYNRVMSLHAQGKTDSAEFFLPMALQAYGMLPTLDADARYHVGVLDLAGGNPPAALAQADTIRRGMPGHLFGFMLRARALELERDTAGARQAYRAFLQNEAAERARKRSEYEEHTHTLDAFHSQATAATGGKPGGP